MLDRRRANDLGRTTRVVVAVAFTATAALLTTIASAVDEFVPRTFDGTGNNEAWPLWGSAGSIQIRSVAGADYADDAFTPPGDDRPTAREVMTDVFLASSSIISTKSALFVAWGQLLTYDLSYTMENSTEPFDIPCNDVVDVWCPLGAASDEISFSRSDAGVENSVRSPINYATAYIDLDFVYGRTEAEAQALRTFEGGLMNVTESGVPFQNDDGTWLIADQRSARFPVTFALHAVLLMEHNLCCVKIAPYLGYEGDEDIYQACRGRTIGVFQHVTENDFLIMLLGESILQLGPAYQSTYRRGRGRRRLDSSDAHGGCGQDDREENDDGAREGTDHAASAVNNNVRLEEDTTIGVPRGQVGEASGPSAMTSAQRRLPAEFTYDDYDDTVNAGTDAFFASVATIAFESSLPATIRVVSEGYLSTDDDGMELTVASGDLAGLFGRNDVASILRGAVLSPAQAVSAHFAAALSNFSPAFKIPADAVQRGRDHGLPTYNAAREAYGLSAVTDFTDVTSDVELAALLSTAYGGDIDNLDALTGGLAESATPKSGSMLGELFHAAWIEQLNRSIVGDRMHHLHKRPIEDLRLTTLSGVLEHTTNATDLPLAVFAAPGVTVCGGSCEVIGESEATLSDSFGISWELIDDVNIAISLRAKGIGQEGMMGIGWGGTTMFSAQDYVICEVLSADEAECIDRSTVSTRRVPPPDNVDPDLTVIAVTVDQEWTSVTFIRPRAALDDQDYDLGQDIKNSADTDVIFAFREGEGVGQHPNANRGAASVNFATGDVEQGCDDNLMFVSLHGALMLIAWLLVAPLGLYYVRYRKGETVEWAKREWYEMHEELMIVASEAVLPLGITAVFASGGEHESAHAYWGYYMIAAVAAQIFTGMMRTKALEAKHANFSFFHRCNKYFHIWAGRFAYLAGVVQCYRGLELVSADDNLVFSAGDGLDLELGTFGKVQDYVFPVWFSLVAVSLVFLEGHKQYRRYVYKGAAKGCGCLEVVNDIYLGDNGKASVDRLIPRTERLPLYTVTEFNDKVLSGQSWLLVDGAILDVSEFSHRHPGGARLILNAVGTDVTHELLGGDSSVGHAVLSFMPHVHPESAWEKARSLVVGYIDEEEEEQNEGKEEKKTQQEEAAVGLTLGKKLRISVTGKSLLLPSRKGSLGGDPLARKASLLNEMATVPELEAQASDPLSKQLTGGRGIPPKRSMSSNRALLERFHVCPLLFRERLGVSGAGDNGDVLTARPVYRYVFQCPGSAQALVQAITGVCYVNMRAQDGGKGVIQRAYNAYAVRVQGQVPTSAGEVDVGGVSKEGRRVFPASENTEGMLCVELRIRLYPDGAMSKILDKLANDPDNPAVRLQGPFVIQKLVPPPAHRNVIMIAAGTGINPMVQLIRDYTAFSEVVDGDGNAAHASRPCLSLLWQVGHGVDLYGLDEIKKMQARNGGQQLEVTVIISGDHRKFNIPKFGGASSSDSGEQYLASPVVSSHGGSIRLDISGSSSRDDFERGREEAKGEMQRLPMAKDTFFADARRKGQKGEQTTGGGSEFATDLPPDRPSDSEYPDQKSGVDLSWLVSGGFLHGKMTQQILEDRFGAYLLETIAAFNEERLRSSAGVLKLSSIGGIIGETDINDTLQALCGSNGTPGELQVVVSGPGGFVSYVEILLEDMGVPPETQVFLD